MDRTGSHEGDAIPAAGFEPEHQSSTSSVLRDRFWTLCQRGFLVLLVGMGFLLLSTIPSPTTLVWVLRGAAFGAVAVSFVVFVRAARVYVEYVRAYRRENPRK